MDGYSFLWNYYFEQEDDNENTNGEFERELKAKEKYYETKYHPTKDNREESV